MAMKPESTEDKNNYLARIKRDWLQASHSPYDLASFGLFSILAFLIVLTFRQYGITWDEPVQNMYGADIARYYVMLLHGRYVPPIDHAANLTLYGGLFDTIASPLNLIFRHHGLYEARHLLNATFGLIGIIGCWKVARFVGGPIVGFLAALFLAITPRYYGGMFNNPKDIPFAVCYIWAVYFILRFAEQFPKVPRSTTVKLGLAMGAALAMRIGALVLFGYLGLAIGMWLTMRVAKDGVSAARVLPSMLASSGIVAAISWVVMLLFWPFAQVNPFTRPFQAFSKFSYYSDWQAVVLFRGALIKGTQLPRTYIVQWLLMTLPEITLIALAVGVMYCAWLLFSRERANVPGLLNCVILILAGTFPIAYVVLRRSVLYNAERHLSFVLPPLACLAAWGGYRAVSNLNVTAKRAIATVVVVYLAFQIGMMTRLHPDEYVYFNQFAGGLQGAAGRYETDYWGNSYREAVGDLAQYLNGSGPAAGEKKYKIYVFHMYLACVTYYFPKNFSLTDDPADADFFIGNTSLGHDKEIDGRVLLKVERLGVPLAVIKELPAAEARGMALDSAKSF